MLGEATLHVSGTFAGEAIRLPIQIAALQTTFDFHPSPFSYPFGWHHRPSTKGRFRCYYDGTQNGSMHNVRRSSEHRRLV
jgi:hypothetical protein